MFKINKNPNFNPRKINKSNKSIINLNFSILNKNN